MGGLDENYASTASVIIYDIASDTWADGPALPRAIYVGRAAVLDGENYLMSNVGSYVLRNGTWAELAEGPGVLPAGTHATCQSCLLG